MKLVITLAFICLMAGALASPLELNDEQKVKAKQYFEECIKQENVSDADAEKLRKKDFANPSKNLKCFGTCFFEKVGTLKDSEVQEDVVLAKLGSILGEEKTKAILAKCKDVKGEDRCDTGFKLYECFESAKAEVMATY
ncbi:General odorant-binding protein 56a [Lucilia cuprina]|nr:General odorant-binding protein 56a [Lucilia cuprina]